ncbi:phosphatidylethanolamine N-methyltransferase [Hysterangium stoloniferum]|nr:phosphatidylethanolamine N-methyltransferase [Hysterangium stoloniferum]
MGSPGARRRRSLTGQPSANVSVSETETPRREEVVWGKTPSGTVFRVPTTHDVLTSLFHPWHPKSHLDLVNLALLGSQLVLFALLPNRIAKPFFFFYFVFWRTAYDAGLGWVLTKQSKKKWIVREVQRRAWLDGEKRPKVRAWIRSQLQGKMGKDYSFDELPLEYNTWLLFRQAVDIILLNDFLSYCMFAFACFRVPDGLSTVMHIMRWISGIVLIAFNLWVKTEAHHVVKDYGWYWGDVFFQRGALVFDGVFEMAPHPMYSVGYAGYYGLSLIVGSYPVLFVSLAAHAAQFAFLVFFENPHIERMYGQRKPIAQRTPLFAPQMARSATPPGARPRKPRAVLDMDISTTPTVTEGETSEPETDLETEMDEVYGPSTSVQQRNDSPSRAPPVKRPRAPTLTQHDLMNMYFRKDTLIIRNIDPFRASDVKLVLLLGYALCFSFLQPGFSSTRTHLAYHFVHALAWRFFHSFGLGLLLKAQSESKFLVRHFITHYHYPGKQAGQDAIREAFNNWKSLYNLSLCMTYASFVGLAWQTYSIPAEWTVGDQLLRHTLGAILIGLHMWTAAECYDVLGVFGWFFGDFFIEDYPATLEYTGIYRFLNNPERTMSGAAFFGLALISGSKLVFALAVISQISHWWFLSKVENPHMQRLYGSSLRQEAGLTKVIKKVAMKNALLLESRAGRHVPEIKRVAQEVKGTFDKVYEETAEAMKELLLKPALSEVVQDTRVLLKHSREKFVISRVTSDIAALDRSKYHITIKADPARFHLGEPITVQWRAPATHSKRDWIGIYRKSANKSSMVTKVSSLGMWVPVYDDGWDGDVPLEFEKPDSPMKEVGEVVFKGDKLPWTCGEYEVRYHHDGKYNVISTATLQIYVEKAPDLTFNSVRMTLMRLVVLALDADPSLLPLSSQSSSERIVNDDHDPDDFNFWSEKQAKRLAKAIEQVFDVEYSTEVIVADANLSALANRILVSKEILH